MAVYAIGDVQGCHAELLRLLDKLRFDPARDRVWLAGDLVNRGPDSLGVLRTAKALGEACICVLGNHDLHLLAVQHGVRAPKSSDTFQDVLRAEDGAALLDWLRHRPLLHHDAGLGITLTHAGLPPEWDLSTAMRLAREVESVLRSEARQALFDGMYGNQPRRWSATHTGIDRWRYAINAFTRMRYCRADGWLDFKHNGRPGSQGEALMPWFRAPGRRSAGETLVFGHWSTLGQIDEPGIHALDTGCVWGGQLTAIRLDDGHFQRSQVDAEPRHNNH